MDRYDRRQSDLDVGGGAGGGAGIIGDDDRVAAGLDDLGDGESEGGTGGAGDRRCITSALSESPCAVIKMFLPAFNAGITCVLKNGTTRATTSFRHSVLGRLVATMC